MSRYKKQIKGIYDRVKKTPDLMPLPVIVNGDSLSSILLGPTERITNIRSSRIKSSIDLLKMSAASAGSLSLSSNQIGVQYAMFIMHKNIFFNTEPNEWLHPEAFKR